MTLSGFGQHAAAVAVDNFARVSTPAPMSRFLAAALNEAGPGSERLYREISRINPPKNLDVSELITASARLSHGDASSAIGTTLQSPGRPTAMTVTDS